MASLDSIEGEGIEGIGWLVLFLLLGIGTIVYMGTKNISMPAGAYPDSIWGTVASWIDGLFAASPIKGGKIQGTVDKWLGNGYVWVVDNLPRTPESKLPMSYGESDTAAGTDVGQYAQRDEPIDA